MKGLLMNSKSIGTLYGGLGIYFSRFSLYKYLTKDSKNVIIRHNMYFGGLYDF